PTFEELLTSQNDKVRIATCDHLRKLGPAARSTISTLKLMLHDADGVVADRAAVALLSVEEGVDKEARQVLLDSGARVIGSLLVTRKLTKRQIRLFRPQFAELVAMGWDEPFEAL